MGWNLHNSYSQLPSSLYTVQAPTKVASPQLVIWNDQLAEQLGLLSSELQSDDGVAILAGNRVVDDSTPIAQAYAGHQFGHFNMLGDGRAILLGEQITPEGKRYDIQLKGSGRTPYSRSGDGRAALGPMLREYIISEALYALDIPTTRSLAVVTTGEKIIREKALPGAILTRVAESHIRVGTFQYAANFVGVEAVQELADYSIQRHYKELQQSDNRYLQFLQAVTKQQAQLIAQWQLVGFIHGVMNTDNMAISGQSIDFGPCAFMDQYDPATVFSSIDTQGRYAYGNQPYMAGWNLARLAESLLPLLHEDASEAVQLAQSVINQFSEQYELFWHEGMKKKLGLYNDESEDKELFQQLLTIMKDERSDYTNTFRMLTLDQPIDANVSEQFTAWYKQWKERLQRQEQSQDAIEELMRQHNPAVIPRNHRVEEVLAAAVEQGDLTELHQLVDVLRKPYAYSDDQLDYTTLPDSCSSPYQTFCGT